MKDGVKELKVDPQGRVLLPREWRETLKTDSILAIEENDSLVLVPKKPSRLEDFFDCAKANVKEFTDYHKLKQEILSV